MRIGLVIYGSLDTFSGGYLYDRMLVRQLIICGHSVEVVSIAWRDYAKHLGDNTNRQWLDRVAHTGVDVLIQDELNHPSLLVANRFFHPQCPVVSLVHHLRSSEEDHPPLLRAIYREVERIYLNSVDAFLYNSRTTRHSVERLLQRSTRSCISYPAADHLPAADLEPDLPALLDRSRRSGPLRILFVGNLIRRKGLHVILEALKTLPQGMCQLSVVGRMDVDFGYTKKMRAMALQLPDGTVTFYGRLDDEQLCQQYRSHHLFVLPSYEGFGIVYLEAMRFGLPVIAATAGAAREIVTDGENGFLVDASDAAAAGAIAGHIRHLHANREYLLALSYAAQRRYRHHPTWQQSMSHAVDWITTLTQGTSQSL